MNLPLFIARRTAKSKSSTQSTMVTIATLAVAVSIAVMIITIAVVAGFKKQIHNTIRDLSADITVTDLAAIYGAEIRPIDSHGGIDKIFAKTQGIESISPYAMRGCILRSETASTGVVVKGIDSFNNKALATAIVDGALPQMAESRRKELLLPQEVADKLRVKVGQRVELLNIATEELPEAELFKVCGTYRPMGHTPIAILFSDIRNVQKSNGWQSHTVSGFEIRVADDYDPQSVADQINMLLFEEYEGSENLSAVSARELFANIFAWLDTHNINATVITVIMFIVALFNMITAMLILLFERTHMVGILKSLGMANNKIRRIFLYQAATIVGRGMVWGNGVAIVLILIQKYIGVIKLDASAYFVTQVPVSIGVAEVMIINIIFAAAILTLLFASTMIVSRIEPSEAVKYE